jgi:hypothetical protein
MSLTRLFCDTDDFCQWFTVEWEKAQIEDGSKKRRRKRSLSHAEIMTIIVFYHHSGYKTFKWFYERYVCKRMCQEFPGLVSYNRFIELLPDVLIPLTFFMQSRCKEGNGIAFIDATASLRKYPHSPPQNFQGRGGAGEILNRLVLRL